MSDIVWVQMTITISGGRADGRPWPDRWGEPIGIPADEAAPLIRAGNAVQVDPPESAQPLPPAASLTPAPVSDPAATARGPASSFGTQGTPGHVTSAPVSAPEPEPEPEPEPDPAPQRQRYMPEPDSEAAPAVPSLADMAPPKPADPKQAWVDYAMAHGETEDEANMRTKADLMQKYGGRL